MMVGTASSTDRRVSYHHIGDEEGSMDDSDSFVSTFGVVTVPSAASASLALVCSILFVAAAVPMVAGNAVARSLRLFVING